MQVVASVLPSELTLRVQRLLSSAYIFTKDVVPQAEAARKAQVKRQLRREGQVPGGVSTTQTTPSVAVSSCGSPVRRTGVSSDNTNHISRLKRTGAQIHYDSSSSWRHELEHEESNYNNNKNNHNYSKNNHNSSKNNTIHNGKSVSNGTAAAVSAAAVLFTPVKTCVSSSRTAFGPGEVSVGRSRSSSSARRDGGEGSVHPVPKLVTIELFD
jgi:hypothetical protein